MPRHMKENVCESVLTDVSHGMSAWMKGFILQTESSRTPQLASLYHSVQHTHRTALDQLQVVSA